MKYSTFKYLVPVMVVSLITGGCSNLTPGENAGIFGGVAGAATGIALGASGAPAAVTVPVAIGAGVATAAIVYVVAKEQASARQRKIAEQRAKLYYAKLDAQEKAALKKKKTRYIAVDTVREANNTQGKKSIMLYDTQSSQVVGNEVYDVKSTPKVGQTAKFDTYSAEYVGSGA